MTAGALPRRRFLQRLLSVPVVGCVARAAEPPPRVTRAPASVVVEYRGWIVHADDRAALGALAEARAAVSQRRGALQ